MSARIPLTPDMAVLFALSFIGIVFVLFSPAASVKRLVLPVTLLVFHVMAFLVLHRSGAIAGLRTVLIAAALAANAGMVWWRIDYCGLCGRTVADRGPAIRCVSCAPTNAEADERSAELRRLRSHSYLTYPQLG